MNSIYKAGIFAIALSIAGAPKLTTATTPTSMGMVTSGWEIVWNDDTAYARHLETGTVIELYRDERGESEEEGFMDFTTLSLVGPALSYSMSWYSPGGAHPSYGTVYATIDLARMGVQGDKDGNVPQPAVNLTDLFGEEAVFEQLMRDPYIQLSLAGKLVDTANPEPVATPENLAQLLERADGGCTADMGHNLLSDFHIPYRLGGNVAVVQIGLTHGCEVNRGSFIELHKLHLPMSDALKDDFDEAVMQGTIRDLPFQKPSFNCAKAGTAIEYAICTSPKLAVLDAAMGHQYKALRKRREAEIVSRIKQDQRDWVATRDRDCMLPGGQTYYEKPGEFAAAFEACLVKAYETRMAAMNEY